MQSIVDCSRYVPTVRKPNDYTFLVFLDLQIYKRERYLLNIVSASAPGRSLHVVWFQTGWYKKTEILIHIST